jgi:hypothetical protein
MTNDATLGGYVKTHSCPPAFLGHDGFSYTAEVYIDDDSQADGRFGAAVLFIRWPKEGVRPEGHLETGYLEHGDTQEIARSNLERLTLLELKEHLDRLVEESKGRPDW